MKVSMPRLLEVSRYLSTKAGQELADFISYVSDLTEQVIRALNKGIGFVENVDCDVKTVTIKSGTETVVNTNAKRPIGIFPIRVLSTGVGIESMTWFINQSGQVVVKLGLTGSPSGTFDVSLVILYS